MQKTMKAVTVVADDVQRANAYAFACALSSARVRSVAVLLGSAHVRAFVLLAHQCMRSIATLKTQNIFFLVK